MSAFNMIVTNPKAGHKINKKSNKLCEYCDRTICACLTLALWTLIIFSLHFVCTLKPDRVIQFLEEREVSLSDDSQVEVRRLLLFLPAILVTLVKLVTPSIAALFERWEQVKITIFNQR